MTFLILTEDPSRRAELAKHIKKHAPDSFCFPIEPTDLGDALQAIRVDCAVCSPMLAGIPSLAKAPRLAVWAPETSAEDMADMLLANEKNA